MQWIKKHKNMIIGSAMVLSALIVAFLFGGPGTDPPLSPQGGEETSCTISISCAAILDNMDALNPAKSELIPSEGIILDATVVMVTEGESAYDVLRRTCTDAGIPLDAGITPGYGNAYIRGIDNIYEFDCGSLSGWKYSVNGDTLNYGCSSYMVQEGDSIRFYYTCNLND